jgi:hypothetical protein
MATHLQISANILVETMFRSSSRSQYYSLIDKKKLTYHARQKDRASLVIVATFLIAVFVASGVFWHSPMTPRI